MIISPEKAFFEKYTLPEEPLCQRELLVYSKYVPEYKKEEPKMDDFTDVYLEEEIRKDKEWLQKAKEKHLAKTGRAHLLEVILAKQIKLANWFGKNCFIVQTSEYDDVINHTDLVIELKKGKKITRLAVDVTTSENKWILDKKRDYIKEEIDQGRLTTLKYFSSKINPSLRGKIEMIPRVIIGTNKEGVKEISELVAGTIEKSPTRKQSKRELTNFYAQIEFLEEAKAQLEYFIKYGEKKYSSDNPVVYQQREALEAVSEILENKKRSLRLPQRARQNAVYKILTQPPL